jgi:hypothetical protein
MNIFEAEKVAGLVGGDVVNSGGNVYIVEIRNPERGTVLCLGDGGWWLEDLNGEHLWDGEGFGL